MAHTFNCVILDDDSISIKILEAHIEQIGILKLIGSFSDPTDAAAAIQGDSMIDFLFLDIGMEVSGLDIARMLRNKVRFIVFVTGYSNFALEAFEHGDAYLVKPVNFDILLRAVNQLLLKQKRQMAFRTAID